MSDSLEIPKKRPFAAVGESFGINMLIWGFDRYVMNEDFAKINSHTIIQNFRTGPVWDTDKFSTNLFAHPYHGSLYFNTARTNGLNFWESIPVTAGGSLMWEFFMETEPPSINDLFATTFGGVELGEITFRLSDLFIDNRTTGAERVGRELISGMISPVRALNRMITGDMWKTSSRKGRVYSSVPVSFIAGIGPRFLAEQRHSTQGIVSTNLSFQLDYGDPHEDTFYSPYEWFKIKINFELFSKQPFISQVNAVGAIWGKRVYEKGSHLLSTGVFQHFDYYDSPMKTHEDVALYRISQAAALGGGLIYKGTLKNQFELYGDYYLTGIALGASATDHFKLNERDYNMGSGYSSKAYLGVVYAKRWAFSFNNEHYNIFTWKGYDPSIDLSEVDVATFNVQGDKGDARLTVFSFQLAYFLHPKWKLSVTNRYFSRQTHYKYFENVKTETTDFILTLGYGI